MDKAVGVCFFVTGCNFDVGISVLYPIVVTCDYSLKAAEFKRFLLIQLTYISLGCGQCSHRAASGLGQKLTFFIPGDESNWNLCKLDRFTNVNLPVFERDFVSL